jgi:NitT/TauT family transport system substrate-binding protein
MPRTAHSTLFSFLAPLLAVLTLLSAGSGEAAAQSGRIALRVALPDGPATRAAGFLIAQQRGYFADAGLDVTFEKPTAYGRSSVDALAEGQADLAVEIMPVAMARRARGADAVHVAQIFQRATQQLTCRAIINEPTKLAGHNVGVRFDGWESSFYAWLSKLSLSYFGTGGGVTIVRQGLDADIFLENEVDCLTTTSYHAPLLLAGMGSGRDNLVTYRYEELDLGLLEDGLYARAEDLENPARRDAFKGFLAAAARGWQSLHDDPTQALRLIKGLPEGAAIDEKALADSLAAVSEAVAADSVTFGSLNEAAYDRTILLLMTGAPDPTLSGAPSNALSDALRPAR